jgi:hypothetical protein
MFKWFNPFTWETLALQILGATLAAGALALYVDSWADDHYSANEKLEASTLAAKQAAATAARNLGNQKKESDALYAKTLRLEADAASLKRERDADLRLRDSLNASESRSKDSLSACLQHTRTLNTVYTAINDFAGRVAAEADGHVTDKIACTNSYPE